MPVTTKSSARATSDLRNTDSKWISVYQSQSVAKPASHGITTIARNPAARAPSRMRRSRGLSGGLELRRALAGGKVMVPSTWRMRGRLTRAGPQHDRTRIGDAHLGMLLFRNSNTSHSQIFTPVSG